MNKTESIHTLLVDDEPEAIELLLALLKRFPEVVITGTANDPDVGLRLIETQRPDLVFLDIRMPRRSGLEMVKGLQGLANPPAVIFVTAYDEYAIHAFKVAAFDYLLKPVDPDTLAETIRRFSATRSASEFRDKVDHLIRHLHQDDRIRVNTRTGYILADPAEILYIQADGNYSTIHFSLSHQEYVTLSLGRLAEMMPEGHFIRISRSVLINRKWLYRVDRKKKTCELSRNGEQVALEVSKEMLKELE
ncbi:MAG TPA: LytTR family DNA-binding domain-containing protein [Bacteroidales bacterium]|nr:LytTR family DNA-binding domain-containing protein [Bacteroidales bacterium]HPS61997.1 LytTR family DNA-binding domain-containing protein [Bacteroidales bacterium]